MTIDPGRSPECWEYDVVDPDADVRVKTRAGFSLDASSLSNVTALNVAILNAVYPVGCYYTQYPDASSNDDATEFPTTQSPATLFGGTWAEQWATESVYFRTRGTLSDTGRTNGKQEDAFQGHRHNIPSLTSEGTSSGIDRGDPASVSYNTSDPVTDGTHGTPRTAAETRTVNRRIKVWKRTAL